MSPLRISVTAGETGPVARLLSLMGVDQIITVRAAADAGSHAEGADCDQPSGGTPAHGI